MSPGHFQILFRSHGEKLGEGLGSPLCHGPEMVDSVLTESTISGPWRSSDLRPSPNFSPRLRDKIWKWPGDEATVCQAGIFNPMLGYCTILSLKLKLVSRPSMSLSVVNPKLIGTWFLPHGAKARIDEDWQKISTKLILVPLPGNIQRLNFQSLS